jgi:hypothetical protein
MDIQVFNKKLHKISALTENAISDGQFSPLERELILSYIRELYDIVLDEKHPLDVRQAPVVVERKAEPLSAEPIRQAETPKAAPIAEPIVVPQPVAHTVVVEEKVVIPQPEPIQIQKVEEVVKAEPVKQVEIQKPSFVPNAGSSDALAELFVDEKISDLSDKLALSPIKDLTKSMGINERIFTQQELFGNNQAHFSETLEGLNKCQSFDEAKQYLVHNVIYKYDWVAEQNIKKAVTFIKLVKRKFI